MPFQKGHCFVGLAHYQEDFSTFVEKTYLSYSQIIYSILLFLPILALSPVTIELYALFIFSSVDQGLRYHFVPWYCPPEITTGIGPKGNCSPEARNVQLTS